MKEILLESSFVSLDIESTSFDSERGEIIEIALVRVEGSVITEKFTTLVKPIYHVPSRITQLTGITNAMLVGKPNFESILPKVLDFIGDSIIVAHNVEKDIEFIDKYYKQMYGKRFKHPNICTLQLAKNLIPNLSSYSLQDLASFFNIEVKRSHRALDDAETTALVFLELLNILWNKLGIGDYHSIKRLTKTQKRA